MATLNELGFESISEDFDFEAKKAAGKDGAGELPLDFFATYSAMANSYGGVVLLGLEQLSETEFSVNGIQNTERVGLVLHSVETLG